MKFKFSKKHIDSTGFTLIEVVASIVILTFVVISFLGLLSQSSKATKTSEDIVDATYLAQTEMENLYLKIKEKSCPEFIEFINNETNYQPKVIGSVSCPAEPQVFKKEEDDYAYILKLEKANIGENLYNISIELIDNTGTTKSHMQSAYIFGGS